MANVFGKTWWGQQWLKALSNIDYGNRLDRGRRYANNGSVKSIDINGNNIDAKVAGSRPTPYKINIVLPPFSNNQIEPFIKKLASKPVIISKLLNKELDPEVLTIAEEMDLKVFPKQWKDFEMKCSCPDWAVPCKHLAAVIYKVSAEIDNNPFLVFDLHNVNLIKLLNEVGVVVKKQEVEIPSLNSFYLYPKKQKESIFNNENAYQKLRFTSLQPLLEPLTALLTDLPVFYHGKGNFKEKYSLKIRKLATLAIKVTQGKINLDELFIPSYLKVAKETCTINHRTNITLAITENNETTVLVDKAPCTLAQFLHQLAAIKSSQTLDYQPEIAALHTTLQFAVHLLANGAIVPQIVQLKNGKFVIRWLPAMLSNSVSSLTTTLNTIIPPYAFVWLQKNDQSTIYKDIAVNMLSLFLTEIINTLEADFSNDIYLDLFFKKVQYSFSNPGEEAFSGGIMVWLQKFFLAQGTYKPMLVVEEVANQSFLVTINIEVNNKKNEKPIPLKDVLTLKKYDNEKFEILQSITQLSPFINGLDAYINSNGETLIIMNNETFTPFLMQMIPAIQLLNINILLPKSLKNILKPKSSISIKSNEKSGKSYIRMDQLLDFDWQVAIGDTLVTEDEFKKLLKNSDGLIKYKTGYIYVNQQDLEKLHKHFATPKTLNAFQMMRAALSGEYFGAKVGLTNQVTTLIKELTTFKEIPLPMGLNATLRPYQHRGYSWMYRNAKIGFGSVIADDMGLGKTLQVITTLLKYKEDGLLEKEKALVIAPTGLLTNWLAEIEKFAPTLKAIIYHGTSRKLKDNYDYDVIITSYGIARSEAASLKKKKWHSLIIDEAQNIKNINTEQTKAIKTIGASNFIAMSGTPVENKLSELWSILDYSNRGFLGSIKEFNEAYGNPIQQYNDADAAEKLKKVTAPFMMRRLKSDKTIISDLPDKIEVDSFSSLVKEQASLYEKTLQAAMKTIEAIDTKDHKALFARQGLVLQMILALKQICNHPTQFLKNNILNASLSGKIELLYDKLDSIIESNEKVLIFTQFTEMGHLLKHFINEKYKEEPLFYHGGCTMKQRKEMVENFQTNKAEKIFILSLKAAGTGLNLTAANHVIHYDLWWNPAVEAQATDRAYRIGQKSNVMVHRFITKNTFEERINEMIQAKKDLANMTVSTGENWIGNLSNKELKNLFAIS